MSKSKAALAVSQKTKSTKSAPTSKKSKPDSPKWRPNPESPLGKVIAVCNQKGGCGKTTTVVNLAACLAARGFQTLVVDLDSQCNATSSLGINASELEETIFDVLVDPKNVKAEDVILETSSPGLHVAPASVQLSEFESRVASEIGRENRLKKALLPVVHLYDFVLIDTPPSLGLLSINALNFAKEIHIAMQAHPFAFDGLQLLVSTIEAIKEELNPTLHVTGIIVTMYDNRTKISKEIVEKIEAMPHLKAAIYKNVIRQNVKLTEASKERKAIIDYDPQSSGSQDYQSLCEEFLERCFLSLSEIKVKPTEVTPEINP